MDSTPLKPPSQGRVALAAAEERWWARGLWRHQAFLKLWMAQTVSAFGSQVTVFALPLIAISVARAGPVDMGVLSAVQFAPLLAVGLFAGVWVDRLPKRPTMIAADVGRALLLVPIAVLGVIGELHMAHLYVVGFLMGTLSVVFDAACQSFLPALVGPEHLVKGNSKLGVSRSIAQVSGPGLAGALVQWLTAPLAIVTDILSFVFSGLLLGMVDVKEPLAWKMASTRGVLEDAAEGLRFMWRQPVLRALACCTGLFNLFGSMIYSVYYLYLTQDLGLAPTVVGGIGSLFGMGALGGAVLAGWISSRLGLRAALMGSIALGAVADLLIPLAGVYRALNVPLLLTAQALIGLATPIFYINQVSVQQLLTPDHLRGRIGATMSVIAGSTLPVGSLVGGLVGWALGLQQTIFLAAAGTGLAAVCLALSPVWGLRRRSDCLPGEAER